MNIPGIGKVNAHPDFCVVATANTCGLGATEDYSTRNVLDRSTLDRFMTLNYDYEYDIEVSLGGVELANFAEAYRYAGEQTGINAQITYRGITDIKVIMDDDTNVWGKKGSFARTAHALDSGLIHTQIDVDSIKTLVKFLPANNIYTKGLNAYVSGKTKAANAKKKFMEDLKVGLPTTPSEGQEYGDE